MLNAFGNGVNAGAMNFMPVVWIPALLRLLTAGQERVTAQGSTLAELIADLDACYPGLADRLCEDSQLRPGLAVVIDGNVARLGMDEPIAGANEVHFVHAIGGGSPPSAGQPTTGRHGRNFP